MEKVVKYTQTAFYNLQKNARKISASIKRCQIHRIKVYLLVLLAIFGGIKTVLAIENTNISYGVEDIKYRIDDKSYIKYNGITQRNTEYYYIKGGQEYTAYCIDLGLNGAELHPDGHYEVDANSKINDEALTKIVLNSYPYKTVEELGLTTLDEAKFASQFAIWCYTSSLNMNLIEPVSKEYQYVVDCIKRIYSAAETNIQDYVIDFSKEAQEEKVEEIEEGLFYTKEIEITNAKNVEKVELSAQEEYVKIIKESETKYKVGVPVENVDNLGSITVNLNYEITAKENAALIGSSKLAGYQDVVVTLKKYFSQKITSQIDFNSLNSKIIIEKLDKDTKEPLQGVVYEAKTEEGESLGTYTTDKNGIITINLKNDKKCSVKITESKELTGYVKDEEEHVIEVGVNDTKNLTFYNEKKKGKIQINKKSKEYNEISTYLENTPLANVSFYVYDEQGELVADITTNENGKALTQELPLGKYYIKEYKTQEGYKLLEEIVEVSIEESEDIVQVNILNENVDIPKKLPVTGK